MLGSDMGFACGYCHETRIGGRVIVQEMYFGTREEFEYLECAACRSICIARVPKDLNRHYGRSYGAHSTSEASVPRASGLRQLARRLRADALLGRFGQRLQRFAERLWASNDPYPWKWFRIARVTRRSKIADLGCGNGALLRILHAQGFEHLAGVDPFSCVELDIPGLRIKAGEFDNLSGTYDLVMMHHSLEHMPDPVAALKRAATLLEKNGVLLVRVPLADSLAHRRFGRNWYQLDAPRHLAVPSLHGISSAAELAGLLPFAVEFDSNSSQFLVSRGYAEGISLVEQREGCGLNVTEQDRLKLESDARTANLLYLGDQAGFFLRAR